MSAPNGNGKHETLSHAAKRYGSNPFLALPLAGLVSVGGWEGASQFLDYLDRDDKRAYESQEQAIQRIDRERNEWKVRWETCTRELEAIKARRREVLDTINESRGEVPE